MVLRERSSRAGGREREREREPFPVETTERRRGRKRKERARHFSKRGALFFRFFFLFAGGAWGSNLPISKTKQNKTHSTAAAAAVAAAAACPPSLPFPRFLFLVIQKLAKKTETIFKNSTFTFLLSLAPFKSLSLFSIAPERSSHGRGGVNGER